MSTVVIVAILAGALFVLISIAVTLQSIEKNRKEKRRLENALNARARNFQYLLDGFPQGFLSRDLQVLVCKCLADAYEQLVQIDPKNGTYQKQRDLNAERLNQFKQKPAGSQAVSLGDLEKIKEVQKLLGSLHKFVAKLMEGKRITAPEAKAYSQQIQHLMLQTTTDGLNLQALEAIKDQKPRLAAHHLQVAIDKLTRANVGGKYSSQLAGFQQQLEQLQQEAEQMEEESAALRAEADKEWDAINKPDDSWKKKAIYD